MRKLKFAIIAAIIGVVLCLGALAEAGDIAINSKNFPDKALRKAVKASCDANGDDVVSVTEQRDMAGIDATEYGVADATGIGLFPDIESLSMGWNKLTKIDLSGNPKLEYVDFDHNRLTSIDLSNSPNLVDLSAPDNKLTKLDLHGCPKLEVLYVPNNKLTTIDVSANPLLEQLVINGNGMKLTFLDLSSNPKLIRLETQGNSIKGIDIAGCTELIRIARRSTLYRDGDVVSWGATEISIDKNTILTNGGDPIYIPEMFPFLKEWGSSFFPEFAEEIDGYFPAVVKKETKIYSDKKLKHPIGTIPAYTSVNVSLVEGGSAYKISNYNGQTCYIASSTLWGMNVVDPNWAYRTLDKTLTAYQRPDVLSASVSLKPKTNIAVVSEKNGWYLIRAVYGNNDSYFFVPEI